MPSSTFFNLPAAKRERLLDAARAEFARVPFPHASINQMIRGAGIPRGSFYMYFKDKNELFSYLVQEYAQGVAATVTLLLDRHEGDLFALFPAVLDYVLATAQDPHRRSAYEDAFQIVGRNGAAIIGSFLEQAAPTILAALGAGVNTDGLDLRQEEDLDSCLRVLTAVTGDAIKSALFSSDPAAVRRRFINTLSILRRGMANVKE